MTDFNTENNSRVLLPTALERQKIFYWLKRISSLTAWRRIHEYFRLWAEAAENSVRVADENGWGNETSLPQSEYALILKCLAHCEEGVNRLSKGDKRVFKFDANGEFVMAARMLIHYDQKLDRIGLGEIIIQRNTPLWAEVCAAVTALAQAWGECAPSILESRFVDDPAPVPYGRWLQNELQNMWFLTPLPAVPDPSDSVFVHTGQYTPCSGIWEPVDVPKPSLISLIKRTPSPKPPFQIVGGMNYLHGGSKAPQVTIQTDEDSESVDTTWRLLWKDDRYSDGIVPEEEKTYRFSKPDTVLPPPPASSTTEELVWAESGASAPVSGKWLAETDLRVAIDVQKGEVLPSHEGRSILSKNIGRKVKCDIL